uniref:Uncharacterized protein n=1 Tax=Anguilla anguilla TaxID=7936 RepID=A0A0E9XSN7_ANGAN
MPLALVAVKGGSAEHKTVTIRMQFGSPLVTETIPT